jgi:hypothetical protein
MQANDSDHEEMVRLLLRESLKPPLEVELKQSINEGPNEVEAITSREPEPVPWSPIKKILWPQVGRVTEPGRYMFRFGFLTITVEDLVIWRDHPTAAFTLVRTVATDEVDEFRLGTFELHDDLSNSER